jgi:hypothetical protein
MDDTRSAMSGWKPTGATAGPSSSATGRSRSAVPSSGPDAVMQNDAAEQRESTRRYRSTTQGLTLSSHEPTLFMNRGQPDAPAPVALLGMPAEASWEVYSAIPTDVSLTDGSGFASSVGASSVVSVPDVSMSMSEASSQDSKGSDHVPSSARKHLKRSIAPAATPIQEHPRESDSSPPPSAYAAAAMLKPTVRKGGGDSEFAANPGAMLPLVGDSVQQNK